MEYTDFLMTKFVWLLLGILAGASLGCTKQSKPADLTMHSSADETLEDISRQAQETFLDFMEKVQNPAPEEGNFMVKYAFQADPGSGFSHEQVWLGNIQVEAEGCSGFVLNTPYYISYLHIGDRVFFETEGVMDWMYFKKGKIIGGRSIRYLIEQIPPSDWEPELRKYYELFQED